MFFDVVVVEHWHQPIEAKEFCKGIGNPNLDSHYPRVFWWKRVVLTSTDINHPNKRREKTVSTSKAIYYYFVDIYCDKKI